MNEILEEKEPFTDFLNKDFYVGGHSLEVIYLESSGGLCLETRSYIQSGVSLIKLIYRWMFTNGLPEELTDIIPKEIIKKTKTHAVLIYEDEDYDKNIILPMMHGIVSIISANDGTPFYYIINPTIIPIIIQS